MRSLLLNADVERGKGAGRGRAADRARAELGRMPNYGGPLRIVVLQMEVIFGLKDLIEWSEVVQVNESNLYLSG